MNPEISVTELRDALDAKTVIHVLDVREEFEREIAAIPVDFAIPLGELPGRFHELDRDADWAVICRSGKRSADACAFLRARGFNRVQNVTGGILAWARDVDPTMTTY